MKRTLLLGTRKGFIAYQFKNGNWKSENISFEGIPVSIAYVDPRTNTWWAALDHGHWGVKLHRSNDRGNTWEEVTAPSYPEGAEVKDGVPATTRYIWAMAHGGKKFPYRIWVGTDPGGLFVSEDNGNSNPDIMWQQNHCSIFRSSDAALSWEDVGQKGGTARFGFAIAVAEDDPDQAWVAPANSDMTRTAIKGALCICRTDDGGKTWKDQRKGLPQENCFDIVYRHALALSGDALAFGTTTGNLFFSPDRGENWQVLNNYLPMVYSVQFAD